MRRRGVRWAVFLGFLALSAVLTLVFWPRGAFLFLVFPFFFPWAWRRAAPPPERRCARCGFAADDPEARYCPRDGAPLQEAARESF